MKLLHLAAGFKHVVWAICDEDGHCGTLDVFMQAAMEHPDLAETMAALLFEEVPATGPPDDPRRAKRLYRDILFELKADKQTRGRQHLGLRIAFFFDGLKAVVCTHGFYKQSRTPPEEVPKALSERARYYEAKRIGALEFESVEDLDNE